MSEELRRIGKVFSATWCKDGWRIDFDLEVDLGKGLERIQFTWNPDEVDSSLLWPFASELFAHWQGLDIEVQPYVWTPPNENDLLIALKRVLKIIHHDDYALRKISTGEEIPAEVLEKAAFARATYNLFKSDPAAAPQDWENISYWMEKNG